MRFKVANYSRLEIRLDTLHIYSSTYCFWLSPRLWSSIFQVRLLPTSVAGQTSVRLKVETWLCHGPELSSVAGASTLQHQSSGIPLSCLPPLNEDNSDQSLVENQSLQPSLRHPLRTFLFEECTVLTYCGLKRSGSENWMSGSGTLRWSGRSREREQSGERGLLKNMRGNFHRSRSAHMLWLASQGNWSYWPAVDRLPSLHIQIES